MVKLAQHIDWPSAEATLPPSTAPAGTHGGRSERRVFPQSHQEVEVLLKDGLYSIELKKSVVPPSKHDEKQDPRHRKTLAELFKSPTVAGADSERTHPSKQSLPVGKDQHIPRSLSEKERSDAGGLQHIRKVHDPPKIEHVPRNPSSRKSTDSNNSQQGESQQLPNVKKSSKGLFALSATAMPTISAPKNPQVDHKSLSIDIPEKMVGLAWLDAESLLLTPGSYSYPSSSFILEQLRSEKTSFIKHGKLHRVSIKEGHLGVAWLDGRAILLEPGVSVHSCSAFSYITTDDQMVMEKEFVLGPFRVVTVLDGEVGIKFCNRKPQVLYSGRHCLSISKVEVFAGFESLLRRQTNLSEVMGTSSDNMSIRADVHVEWQIKPEDAAAARLANVTDVEGAMCEKLRRAFNLAMWEHKVEDIDKIQTSALSSEVRGECLDLFEEGWTVTLWELQCKNLVVLPSPSDTHLL